MIYAIGMSIIIGLYERLGQSRYTMLNIYTAAPFFVIILAYSVMGEYAIQNPKPADADYYNAMYIAGNCTYLDGGAGLTAIPRGSYAMKPLSAYTLYDTSQFVSKAVSSTDWVNIPDWAKLYQSNGYSTGVVFCATRTSQFAFVSMCVFILWLMLYIGIKTYETIIKVGR